jgi:hypothetical protein
VAANPHIRGVSDQRNPMSEENTRKNTFVITWRLGGSYFFGQGQGQGQGQRQGYGYGGNASVALKG